MTLILRSNTLETAADPGFVPQYPAPGNFKQRLLANKKHVYSLYITLDSGKLSLNTIKYLFDIYYANNELASKAMSEWLRSPEGFITAASSASGFIVISLLAIHLDERNKNWIIFSWPYLRDSLKGLRNTHRGIQSTLTLIHILDIEDLRDLIVPVSVALGAITVLNRIWFRMTSTQRTKMIAENKTLLAEIKAANELSLAKITELSCQIQTQSKQLRIQLLISSVISGVIEGLNPFIGTLIIGSLTPWMLTIITSFCAVYFLATLATKIYDEINAQRQLNSLKEEINLVLLEKQTPNVYNSVDIVALPVLVNGVKNGLTGYKYIMLTINTILFISPIQFKSIQPIHRALLGITALLSSSAYSFISSHKRDRRQPEMINPNDKMKFEADNRFVSADYYWSGCEKPAPQLLERKKVFSMNQNSFFGQKGAVEYDESLLNKSSSLCYCPVKG